jgi:hypothetical protein
MKPDELSRLRELAAAIAERQWFMHDFSEIGGSVDVSCDHPASITVATMGNGMTATIEEKRAHAAFIAAANPATILALLDMVERQRGRVVELERLINNPHTDDFLEAVRLEAAHQQERWGAEHDVGKADVDWFWLIGYLAGKAVNKPEKRLHHIITTAAACMNWHAHLTGEKTNMRPGIDPVERGLERAASNPSTEERA